MGGLLQGRLTRFAMASGIIDQTIRENILLNKIQLKVTNKPDAKALDYHRKAESQDSVQP